MRPAFVGPLRPARGSPSCRGTMMRSPLTERKGSRRDHMVVPCFPGGVSVIVVFTPSVPPGGFRVANVGSDAGFFQGDSRWGPAGPEALTVRRGSPSASLSRQSA